MSSTQLTRIIFSGVLVPGGFGSRGTEGMVLAAKWAREQNRPYLGICLGFQIAVIEWSRSICGLTSEYDSLKALLSQTFIMCVITRT